MKAVLDTNVLVSGLIIPKGPPARITQLFENDTFHLVVSAAILAEYRRVLLYPRIVKYHRLSAEAVDEYLASVRRSSIVIEPARIPRIIKKDPSDDIFLAAATAGEADFIISGDRHLLDLGGYRGIEILSPAAFVEYMKTEG